MATYIFENGDTAKDKITGFEGIVTGRSDYITGCNQYCLQPKSEKSDDIKSAKWFDEHRLERVGTDKIELTPTPTEDKTKQFGACDEAPTK